MVVRLAQETAKYGGVRGFTRKWAQTQMSVYLGVREGVTAIEPLHKDGDLQSGRVRNE
jgi:hypothetical protein